MKHINFVLKAFVPLSLSFSLHPALAQESYEISRRLSCEAVGGQLYLVRDGERLPRRARKKIIRKLRHKLDGVESEKRWQRLKNRLDGVRFCKADKGGGEEGGGEESGGGGEGGGSVGGATTCAKGFAKQVNVFGVRICATESVPDDKLMHTARIMAEYLDNDEDGNADDPYLLETLLGNNAFLEMYKNERELNNSNINIPDGHMGQPHFASETFPGQMAEGVFDITLEEVWHLISSAGLHYAYPEHLGENPGSRLTNAMDLARGGRFMSIPNPYPAGAWYTYDDQTCEYICMASEYFYWALTSLLGAQDIPGRLEEIQNEWRPNTPEKLRSTDPAVYELLTDPSLKLPTRLPDGVYNGGALDESPVLNL